MMLTKRLLSGVLVACSFGALACSDEPAVKRDEIDAGLGEPEDEDEEIEEDEDEDTRARPRDAGSRRDAGRDAGRDGGRTSTSRGIDSGTGGGEGPEVVDTERDPAPGGGASGAILDQDEQPAYLTTDCPPGFSTVTAANGRSASSRMDGCCLKSGQCGVVSQLAASANTCVTLSAADNWATTEGEGIATLALPRETTCAYGSAD